MIPDKKRPIKILHVINSLSTGGAQVCLRDITNTDSPEFEHYIYTLRPDTHKFKFRAEVFDNKYPNYDIRKLFYLISLCKKLEIDIIHAHLHKSIMLSVLAKIFYPCKVVVHEHGPIERKGIDYTAYRFFIKLFAGKVSRFIAVSGHIKKMLVSRANIDQKKITVIRNGVDRSLFVPNKQARQKWRKYYDLEGSFVVGFIGRLKYVKGIDILIKAFELLDHKEYDIKLVIAGDGGDKSDFENLASDSSYSKNIVFTGFCSNPNELMQAFDAAAVPSLQDPCPLVIFELLALGRVIITSGVEGIGEVVKDGYNGLVFENTPQGIAKTIHKLLEFPQMSQQIRENGLETAKEYDINIYRRRIHQLYSEIHNKDSLG